MHFIFTTVYSHRIKLIFIFIFSHWFHQQAILKPTATRVFSYYKTNTFTYLTVSLIYTLAEPALLYRSLNVFVTSADDAGGGLIGQSLRAAIEEELRGYVALICGLEGEIRRVVAMADPADSRGIEKVGVTLKRCVVWTREATMGLRLMRTIVEQAKGMHSKLHYYQDYC